MKLEPETADLWDIERMSEYTPFHEDKIFILSNQTHSGRTRFSPSGTHRAIPCVPEYRRNLGVIIALTWVPDGRVRA